MALRKSQSSPGLQKSSSLPGIMMLGTSAPQMSASGSFGRKPTLGFRLHHGPEDLHRPPKMTPELVRTAELLRNPGWRLQAARDRAGTPPTSAMVEDLVPKNMRHPRNAPAWLKHDRQVIRFYGFFQESVTERADENSRYRPVLFMFYMEDGTLQISEPKVENSGLPQGTLLKRQRVPRDDGMGIVGPDDFRCGQQTTLHGRTYQITGCDRFTRWFYEENGIDVGEDEPMVEDRYTKNYKFNTVVEKGGLPMTTSAFDAKEMTKFQVGHPPADKKEAQFLLNDRKVLRFNAYWDDHTLYGARMYFRIHYYLSDNTMEINEAHARNSGRDNYPCFYKRAKMFKQNTTKAYPGMLAAEAEMYMPEDLLIGESMNVWGRSVVLYDCDDFTRKFYAEFMGFDQPTGGQEKMFEQPPRHQKLKPPPHNGIGTEDDSLGNVKALVNKQPKQDLAKLMTLSGENCRFEARMANGEPEDDCRRFCITWYPDTDRIGVHENQSRNSGHMAGKFREKSRIKNPATGKYFTLADLYVGATVSLCAQPFQIIRADEHALQYLENHPDLYPFADPRACARRVALAAGPELQDSGGIDPDTLKDAAASAGVDLVDHEVITLLRHFGTEMEEGGVLIDGPQVLRAAQGSR